MTSTASRRISPDLLNDPFFIGFDTLLNKVSRPTVQSNYPPYNIIKTKENLYELQLAIAGFKSSDLDIEFKDSVLTVKGNQSDTNTTHEYVHKGISTRSFERSFALVDTIVVRAADLADGILTVQLENIIPEERKPHKITIGSGTVPGAHTFLKG